MSNAAESLAKPIAKPPPGITANFINPENLHRWDVLTQTLCLTVVTLLICMRLYTKGRILRSLGWDDYTAVAAWTGLISYGAVQFVADTWGSGVHFWNIRVIEFIHYAYWIHITQILYSPVILLTKISILLLYLRVFQPARTTKTIIHLVLWINVIFYTIGTFVEIFQCTPRLKIIEPWLPGTCIDQVAAELSAAIINSISDFAILALPIATVSKLNVARQKKVEILGIFGTGLFGCIASVVRVGLIVRYRNTSDATWDWYSLNLWSYAEISCGIICSCLPALPAFLRYIRGQQLTRRTTKHSHSSASTGPSAGKPSPKMGSSPRVPSIGSGGRRGARKGSLWGGAGGGSEELESFKGDESGVGMGGSFGGLGLGSEVGRGGSGDLEMGRVRGGEGQYGREGNVKVNCIVVPETAHWGRQVGRKGG